MSQRGFFVIILLLNVALAAWVAFKPKVPDYQLLPQVEAGTPKLVLLSELEEQMGVSQTPAVILEQENIEALLCFTIGPFPSKADVRHLIKEHASDIFNVKQRETMTTQDLGYWVYLPAVEQREKALKQARDLSELGVRDYYVVTAGDRENTVSLGLFKQKENAVRRREYIASLGFDAKLTIRKQELAVYFLDYATRESEEIDLSEITRKFQVENIERSCRRK